ncbi:MAG: precorrin-6y C5,15-methyltransferase (decarboxylating) subunit CbiE [Desulfovibrionaceae bacterium]|nr:precorrin-6y C5,15-methyltransferase (decarboxylating) subunit CbiE [Desulfovibrionaceae bacterium]
MALTDRKPVHVLGMRPGSLILDPEARSVAEKAQVLVGERRLLAAWALACPLECPHRAEKQIPVSGSLDPIIARIRKEAAAGKLVAVLTDGDPLFFGIGRRLIQELGPDKVAVHPNLTSVQVAAARLGLDWQDLAVVEVGERDFTPLFSALAGADRVMVLTGQGHGPSAIARALLEKGVEGLTLTVIEDLGTPQEIIRRLSPQEVWDLNFSRPSLVLVERGYPPEIELCLGVPDHYYFSEHEPVAQQPVRAAGLAALNVAPGATVWDLGAGCGCVAIEAAHLARNGRVFAVERDLRRAAALNENIRRMGAWPVHLVRGDMPRCLKGLPDPDRIFVSGGLDHGDKAARKLLDAACARLKPGGRMVVQCTLLDTLLLAKDHFQTLGWRFGAIQIQASTSDNLAGDLRFTAQNPVFVLWAEKP